MNEVFTYWQEIPKKPWHNFTAENLSQHTIREEANECITLK